MVLLLFLWILAVLGSLGSAAHFARRAVSLDWGSRPPAGSLNAPHPFGEVQTFRFPGSLPARSARVTIDFTVSRPQFVGYLDSRGISTEPTPEGEPIAVFDYHLKMTGQQAQYSNRWQSVWITLDGGHTRHAEVLGEADLCEAFEQSERGDVVVETGRSCVRLSERELAGTPVVRFWIDRQYHYFGDAD